MAKVSPTVHKKFNTRSSTAAAAAAANMTPVSPRLVQTVHPTNVKAVTGVKRGHGGAAGATTGPKAKEVKVFRVQPNVAAKKATAISSSSTPKTTGAALSNGVRKILINTIDVKDLRTIKIINANTLKHPHLKMAAANLLQQSKQGLLPKNAMLPKEQYERQSVVKQELLFDEDSGEEQQQQQLLMDEVSAYVKREDVDDEDAEEDSDDEDEYGDRYPSSAGRGAHDKLVLTAEEKRLLSKEGIQLPSNYPLTKHEERELKRIRRKIRNKISAQDSRKRKKEYVDGLEERVKQCTDENQSLMKRIKMLQGQNQSLMTQMKKLQSLLSKTNTNGGNGGGGGGGNSSSAQPTTCLMVLLLSMALIAAPNLKLGKRDASAKETELAEAIQESLKMQQNRRNLLYDNVNGVEDEDLDSMMVCSESDFIAENENFIESFYNRIGVGSGGSSQKKAAAAAAVAATAMNGKKSSFMDLDLDDTVWRAPKNAAAQSSVSAGFAGMEGAAAAAFSTAANGRNILGLGASAELGLDKVDNVLIMELRNNLMMNSQAAAAEEADGAKKKNNSMHVMHREGILFQD